ncbi:DUF4380 domain-containing protein [Segetibacter koreensis]|uniref:DUF4380 domain-containing protein n=1 Tax=Segetibacter koreensis TaxID=398037 RepID=UPI00036C8BE8|nr:DUF4380 domain-containing protein [Segetibacter koreensis]
MSAILKGIIVLILMSEKRLPGKFKRSMFQKLMIIVVSAFSVIASSGQTTSNKAAIKKKGELYRIKVQNQILEIDPSIGGRITSLQLDGKEFLTGKSVNDFNWGSTFWISPQSNWDWPPSAELDNKLYSAKIEANELIMVSQKDSQTGLVVTKKISGNSKGGSYTFKYLITNPTNKVQKVAPWEVTRVQTNGIAFFPLGNGERRGGLIPLTSVQDGICWFTYQKSKLPVKGDRQLYTDGAEGWLAEVNENVILVKKFPDIPLEKNAPKEGEIELFASPVEPGKSYVEIEHQGAYEELQPEASLIWIVTWYLRKLPAGIKPEAGNTSLLSYVRKLVK